MVSGSGIHRRGKYMRRIGFGLVLVWAASLTTLALLSPPALAVTSCGDAETSIISCEAAKSGTPEANDSANNPVVAVLTFVMQVLTGAVGIAAVGALIYAGILYAAAGGDSSQVQKSKTLIKDTVIGIVCYAGMILILNFVIPGGVFGQQSTTGGGTAPAPTGPGEGGGNGKPGSKYSVTLASWNTYVSNSTNKGSTAKSLLSSIDVLGMQEVHKSAHRNEVKAIASSTVGVYIASKPSSGDTHMASYPIVYNKTKLTLVSARYKRLGSVPGLTDRYAVYARFRIKSTQQEFYFVNTHLPPGVEKGGKPSSKTSMTNSYKKLMSTLVSTVKGLESAKIPVFVVGDFNVNYRKDECETSWFPCKSMHSAGLDSAFAATKLAGIPGSYGTHESSSRLIDYVWVWKRSDVTVNSVSVVNGSGNGYRGSDHKPSLAKVTITTPSSSNPSSPGAPAAISLSGVENFRDVSTLTPGVVKPGVLYRSAKLQNATSSDVSKLASTLKGGIIVDLRTKSKAAGAPDKAIPSVPNTNYNVTSASSKDSYVKVFVKSASDRKKIAKAITDIANAKGSVLIHCTAGKDRTGWTVAMIMYILGATDKQVMTEYLKSKEAGDDFKVDSAWLNAALDAATNKHKRTVMDFITSSSDGLGLSNDVITRIRTKFGAK